MCRLHIDLSSLKNIIQTIHVQIYYLWNFWKSPSYSTYLKQHFSLKCCFQAQVPQGLNKACLPSQCAMNILARNLHAIKITIQYCIQSLILQVSLVVNLVVRRTNQCKVDNTNSTHYTQLPFKVRKRGSSTQMDLSTMQINSMHSLIFLFNIKFWTLMVIPPIPVSNQQLVLGLQCFLI